MAQGYLVTLKPSKSKRAKGTKVRFLRNDYAVRNFVQGYIDYNDTAAKLNVQVFNSNGYLERTVKGEEALAEFRS